MGVIGSASVDALERLARVYARRVSTGETGYSAAIDALSRLDQREAEKTGEFAANPVHHTRRQVGGREPRDPDFWMRVLDQRIAALETGGAAALWPPPLRPRFPSRAVPLAEGQRLAALSVSDIIASTRMGTVRELLMQTTVGSGKSYSAIQRLSDLLEAAHAAGFEGALYYLVPHHKLSAEIRDDIIRANPGRKVAVWYGMTQDDPAAPGEKMCRAPELPAKAREAGLSGTVACKACPLRDACGYRSQGRQDAEIWIAAHALGVHRKPAALPNSAATVWDEDFTTGAGLVGCAKPEDAPTLAVADLAETRTGPVTGAAAERLIRYRARAFDLCMGAAEGRSRRHPIEAAGFTVADLDDWQRLEWATEPTVDLEGLDRDGIEAALAEAAGSGFNRVRPLLAKFWALLLRSPHAVSVNVEHVASAKLGRNRDPGPAIRFAWRAEIADWCKKSPKLFLGATTSPELLRHWAPSLEVREIEVATPKQRVTQVVREFGRTFFTKNPGNVRAVAGMICRKLAQTTGAVLAVTQVAVETRLVAEIKARLGGTLPDRLRFAHHGNLVGLNEHADAETIIVIGRPAVNREGAERIASIIAGEPIEMPEATGNGFPLVPAGIRMADGSAHPARQPCHPHPLAEAVRWAISEGAVLQAIGRGRGVRREVEVLYLGGLALPLTVTEVVTWKDARPNRLEAATAEALLMGRALPLAPADLSAARNDLWETPKAAERYLAEIRNPQIPYKEEGACIRVLGVSALYRKPGIRKWSKAIVPAIGGLEALRAELASQGHPEIEAKWVEAQPAQAPAAPREEAPAPPPPQQVPASPALRLARLSLALDKLKPDLSRPSSIHTPARVNWWTVPELRKRHETIRVWEMIELAPVWAGPDLC